MVDLETSLAAVREKLAQSEARHAEQLAQSEALHRQQCQESKAMHRKQMAEVLANVKHITAAFSSLIQVLLRVRMLHEDSTWYRRDFAARMVVHFVKDMNIIKGNNMCHQS